MDWLEFLTNINNLENGTRSDEKTKEMGYSQVLALCKCLGGAEGRRFWAFLKTESHNEFHIQGDPPSSAHIRHFLRAWELNVCLSRIFLLNNWLRKLWKESAGSKAEGNPNSLIITRSALSGVWLWHKCMWIRASLSRGWKIKQLGRHFWEAVPLFMFTDLTTSFWLAPYHKQSTMEKEVV